MGQRRALAVPLAVLRGAPAPLQPPPRNTDIGRAVHRLQVDHRRADHRRFEPLRMPDQPRRHVAAVGVTMHPQPLRIHIRPLAHRVQRRQQIQRVLPAPVLDHRVCEIGAVGRGAARIDEQHQITRAGDCLVQRLEALGEHTVRPAVNIEHQRVAPLRIEARREHQPERDRRPAPLDLRQLHPPRLPRRQILGADRRERRR